MTSLEGKRSPGETHWCGVGRVVIALVRFLPYSVCTGVGRVGVGQVLLLTVGCTGVGRVVVSFFLAVGSTGVCVCVRGGGGGGEGLSVWFATGVGRVLALCMG